MLVLRSEVQSSQAAADLLARRDVRVRRSLRFFAAADSPAPVVLCDSLSVPEPGEIPYQRVPLQHIVQAYLHRPGERPRAGWHFEHLAAEEIAILYARSV